MAYRFSGERAEEIKKHIESSHEQGLKPLEEELEKGPEELLAIGKINRYFAEEFASLDLPTQELLPEQFHLLPHERFETYKAEGGGKIYEDLGPAFQEARTAAIYIDKDAAQDNRALLYHAMFHEATHAQAFIKFVLRGEDPGSYGRGGYFVGRLEAPGVVRLKLRAFNEAVTEKIAAEMMAAHAAELVSLLKFTPEEQEADIEIYPEQVKILDLVLQGIAEKTRQPAEEVWRRFKRGYFSGEMMHVRDIERAFGKGSLDALRELTISPDPARYRKIERYFSTRDEKERQALGRELLKEPATEDEESTVRAVVEVRHGSGRPGTTPELSEGLKAEFQEKFTGLMREAQREISRQGARGPGSRQAVLMKAMDRLLEDPRIPSYTKWLVNMRSENIALSSPAVSPEGEWLLAQDMNMFLLSLERIFPRQTVRHLRDLFAEARRG